MTAAKLLVERRRTAALYPNARVMTGWRKPRPAKPQSKPEGKR